MAKRLHYFDLPGRAEFIRYILHYSGQNFEDVRYERSKWPIKNIKDNLPYGQLPLYEEGNKSLNQSVAIARYLASKTDLLPSDPWQQAILDAAVLNINDFWGKAVVYLMEKDPVKKAAIKKQVSEEVVPYYFSRFEKELSSSGGHFGGKLSWADFILVGMVETANLFFGEEFEKKYPSITALMKKVRALPGIKEYIASRKPYAL
uniref:glutathione transferase n=1 Tax=Cnaphalocrocis medinalis TaxID=437488 RepID=A0A0A7KNK5_CNAME|nr:glutathione S-transferase sigma 4 [Cnaphalocrocis medinalis]